MGRGPRYHSPNSEGREARAGCQGCLLTSVMSTIQHREASVESESLHIVQPKPHWPALDEEPGRSRRALDERTGGCS